jgi:uncharacterized protein YggE
MIDVSVNVNRNITPDEIYVNFTITEKDNRGKKSVDEQETNAIGALSDLGIDVKSCLTIVNLESSLQKQFLKRGNILESREYRLKTSNGAEASRVIETLNNLLISNVELGETRFSAELEKKVKDELLTEAAIKAKENATILAEALNAKVGKVIYINNHYSFERVGNSNYRVKSLMAFSAMADVLQEESIDLDVAKQSISLNVNCKFAIEQ